MKKFLLLSFALVGLTLAGCAAEETTPADTTDPAMVETPVMEDDTLMMDDTMMDDTTGMDAGMMEEAPAADTTM